MMDFFYAERRTHSAYQPKPKPAGPITEEMLRGLSLPVRYLAIRRALEVLVILASLPLSAPLAAVIALAVRLDSPGPVLYRQRRPGRDGRIFFIIKFRTMYEGADRRFAPATVSDSRVTRLGRFLRRHRLDELPQLVNVLRGEMSIIGPRPDPCEQATEYDESLPLYGYRRLVHQGITGWGQVRVGYAPDFETARERLRHDLYYIANISWHFDLRIIARTVLVLFSGKGSR